MIYNGGEVGDLPDFYSQECHPLMDFTPEYFTEHVPIRKIAVCVVIAVLGLGALACGITGNQGSDPTTALSSTAAAEGLAKTDETGDDPEAEITALKKADSFTVDPVDSSGPQPMVISMAYYFSSRMAKIPISHAQIMDGHRSWGQLSTVTSMLR
jgi:hypothetical protein